ncbi:MAG TPA: serine hydrolase, partial [Labilithrix sp.]|nr:serine hydrolase [Labilithrix sp.]
MRHGWLGRLVLGSVLFVAAGCAGGSGRIAPPHARAAVAVEEGRENDGGLRFGFPDEEGLDAKPLVDLTNDVGDSQRRVFSLLVSKNGRVVYELYTSSLTRKHAHYVMSVTKSVTSALVGIAIGRGLVANAETSVADALPESAFPDAAARERFRSVTIRHVLGMSALDAEVPPHRKHPDDVARGKAFWVSANRTRFALGQALLPEPGVSFQYTDITPLIATGIVTYASGTTALEFANEHLFGPLGFENQEWMHEDETGLDNGAYGLRMRPIDMQKFGLLYMNGGMWGGKQIVPRRWVDESFSPWIKSNASLETPNYGWYWWTVAYAPGWTARVCKGWKGQRIAVVPERNVVVTMTGNVTDDEEAYFARLLR